MKKRKRPSKDEYYLGIAEKVAQRATCLRRIFGAVLVSGDVVVGTGYCGSPRGAQNCSDIGYCMREELKIPSGEQYEKCKSVHAEVNAIIATGRERATGGAIYIYLVLI